MEQSTPGPGRDRELMCYACIPVHNGTGVPPGPEWYNQVECNYRKTCVKELYLVKSIEYCLSCPHLLILLKTKSLMLPPDLCEVAIPYTDESLTRPKRASHTPFRVSFVG